MKTIYKIFCAAFFILIISGCEKWLDINQDPDSPTGEVVSEGVILPGILATISYELTAGFPTRVGCEWVGQFSLNGPAPDVNTFKILDTDVNNMWEYTVYTDVLKNLKLIIDKAESNGNMYYKGIGQVMTAYTLAIATDVWDAIPWSQALQPDEYPKPVYDSQEDIYIEIFSLIDSAIENFAYTGTQSAVPGDDDLLYFGDMDAWSKLAYALKARYAMRLSYAYDGAQQADEVLAALDNSFESNSDDADFAYFSTTGAENPWQQWMNKFNYLYLDTNMYTIMSKYNDPRLEVICDTTYFEGMTGQIVPHQNGLNTSDLGVTSKMAVERTNYDDNENIQPYFITKSTAVPFITYSEVCFLKAEAYAWKSNFIDAEQYMKEGTKAALLKIEKDNASAFTESEADAYLATLPALPTSFEEAQKMIIELKYISNLLSIENYNDYRRTHYPELVLPLDAEYDHVPYRFPYSTSSKLYNAENVPSVNIGQDKVWWDQK